MDRVQKAVNLFNSGFNCSQAVLAAFSDPSEHLESSAALKVAGGFGGGIGRTGNMCGALSGAIMALGLHCGTADPSDKAAKQALYEKTRLLVERFQHQTGSVMCRDLLGFDLSTLEGQETAKTAGAFDRCDGFVRIAAEIVEDMLAKS